MKDKSIDYASLLPAKIRRITLVNTQAILAKLLPILLAVKSRTSERTVRLHRRCSILFTRADKGLCFPYLINSLNDIFARYV